MTDSRTDHAGTDQERLWDADAAARYDTPGEGMFAPDTLDPAVDRLAALAGQGSAVELAVGTGRVAIPLAARGVPVTGIEISQHMVARLREKADERTLPVVVGDMATARVPGEHTLVYLVDNTISNLLTPDAQVECFRNAARHLAPGGRFVVELWVPELRALPPGRTATVWLAEPSHPRRRPRRHDDARRDGPHLRATPRRARRRHLLRRVGHPRRAGRRLPRHRRRRRHSG
ncbi:class I SAM-dependent DNA methyltransferase [Cellulosimicrobium cellulans]|uniref:class I SAM-dependent DNA methyltransferase n=1 Tax=Cellulosimicrobium cellulans TaxID=1710 RepID=UPI003C4C6FC8